MVVGTKAKPKGDTPALRPGDGGAGGFGKGRRWGHRPITQPADWVRRAAGPLMRAVSRGWTNRTDETREGSELRKEKEPWRRRNRPKRRFAIRSLSVLRHSSWRGESGFVRRSVHRVSTGEPPASRQRRPLQAEGIRIAVVEYPPSESRPSRRWRRRDVDLSKPVA